MTQPISTKCQYFKDCGGCKYLDLSDFNYRKNKSENLVLELKKHNILTPNFIFEDNSGNAKRRKINLQVNSKNEIGFFQKHSNKLIKIENCYICEKEISDLIAKLQILLTKFESKIFKNIEIVAFDNVLDLCFYSFKPLKNHQINKILEFSQVNKLNSSYFHKKSGNIILNHESPKIKLANYLNSTLELELDSKIFIQASRLGLKSILQIILQIGENIAKNHKKTLKIADIYSGFGIYSFSLAKLPVKITAFEGDEAMIELIKKNSEKNNLSSKINFELRDLYNFPVSWQELKDFDFVVINPPRNGAMPQIKEIVNSKLKNVIYVSCNYQTFIRDSLILIEGGFTINFLTAIDQFYSTDHFEIIAHFNKI